MKIYVNQRPVHLLPGMTVMHALISAGLLDALERGCQVFDEWDNEVGLDGAISEGVKLFVK